MTKLETQSGDIITVDADLHRELSKVKWYTYCIRGTVSIGTRSQHKESIIKYILMMRGHKVPEMTKGWYTMLNGNVFDCRCNNISIRRPTERVDVYCSAEEKTKWKKLDVDSSLTRIVRTVMNRECDKAGVK